MYSNFSFSSLINYDKSVDYGDYYYDYYDYYNYYYDYYYDYYSISISILLLLFINNYFYILIYNEIKDFIFLPKNLAALLFM